MSQHEDAIGGEPAPTTPPSGERRLAAAAMVILLLAGSLVVVRGASAGVAGSDFPAPAALPAEVAIPGAVAPEALSAALTDAGCEVLVDGEPLEDRRHLDPDAPPPAAALYPDVRPAHSGRHVPQVLTVPDRVPSEPIDERVVLHNMEHGSVVVWFDAGEVDLGQVVDAQRWMRERRAVGFESRAAGGIFVSPAPLITSGKAVAYRAWGHAVDCDRFNVTVADAFVGDHWGSRGESPEASLSPFPAGVMGEVGSAI